MRDSVRSLGLLVIGGVIAVVAGAAGVVSFGWPWDLDEIATIDAAVVVEEPAQVFEIEPIRLDCRARVHAEVPVEGRREHRVLGQVYRTDTVQLTAIGDVDTCVDPSQVEIGTGADGRISIVVPADSIQFVRPRVDMERTAASVRTDKGLVGKLTDVFPWVDEGNGLTSAAYTYAQRVIGGSDCMQAAYSATSTMLRDAYRSQILAQGGDPGRISVRIEGSPDFGADDAAEIDGADLEVSTLGVTCAVAPGADARPPVSSS